MRRNITKGVAIYEITDGTVANTVSFLAPHAGFHLMGVEQSVPESKSGGVYQDSPLADGKRLTMRFFDNAVDTLSLAVNDMDQNNVIEDEQRLRRLLEKAIDYWTTRNRIDIGPVWIKRRGADETNTSYAIIYNYSAPKTSNPFGQPLFSYNPTGEVQLALEHGFWSDNPPLESDCVKISNIQSSFSITQVNSAIAAATDDCFVIPYSSSIYTGGVFVAVGKINYPDPGEEWDIGFRFQLNVPQGATITDAYITMVSETDKPGDNVTAIVYGQAADNSNTFSTYADFAARPLTSTSYVIPFSSMVAGGIIYISNLDSIVQEVVSRAGWVSGNYITIFVKEHGSVPGQDKEFASYENTFYDPATLYVSYQAVEDVESPTTCLEAIHVSNTKILHRITNIIRADASEALVLPVPYELFPIAPPAPTHCLYIGSIFTGTLEGPFNSIIFNISVAGDQFDGVWEYYNGGWVTLNVQDNVRSGYAFQSMGVHGVFWRLPTDWTPVVVGGVNAYWVRFRITSVGASPISPIQANYHPYAVISPFVDIPSTEISGDVPALLKMRINNISDDHDADPGTPNMEFNRIMMGLRSLTRGNDFSAYIPIMYGDTGVKGVAIATVAGGHLGSTSLLVGGSTSIIYDPVGIEGPWVSYIVMSISDSVSQQYCGKYATFIRVRQVGGTVGDISVRVTIYMSTMAAYPLLFQSEKVYPAVLAENEMLYLGVLEIPADTPGYEIGNMAINIMCENTAASPGDLYLYDLILMPVDECSIVIEGNDVWENAIGYSSAGAWNNIQFVDSISDPKKKVLAEVRKYSVMTGLETSIADFSVPIYNNALSVKPNTATRIWFAVESKTAVSKRYQVIMEVCYSVMLEKQQRYLGMRGTK